MPLFKDRSDRPGLIGRVRDRRDDRGTSAMTGKTTGATGKTTGATGETTGGTSAMTGKTTGATGVVAGLDCSGSHQLDDQACQ